MATTFYNQENDIQNGNFEDITMEYNPHSSIQNVGILDKIEQERIKEIEFNFTRNGYFNYCREKVDEPKEDNT